MKKICIIGGGFYGAAVSLFLNSKNKYDITLLEKEPYLCYGWISSEVGRYNGKV